MCAVFSKTEKGEWSGGIPTIEDVVQTKRKRRLRFYRVVYFSSRTQGAKDPSCARIVLLRLS